MTKTFRTDGEGTAHVRHSSGEVELTSLFVVDEQWPDRVSVPGVGPTKLLFSGTDFDPAELRLQESTLSGYV